MQIWHIVLWFVLFVLALVAAMAVPWVGFALGLVMAAAMIATVLLAIASLNGSRSVYDAAVIAFWLSPLPAVVPIYKLATIAS